MREINVTMPDALQRNLMVAIYKELVSFDNEFHIFPEGETLQVRCKDESVDTVLRCVDRDINVVEAKLAVADYVDPNPDVAKYQKQFEKIFHAETIIGCKLMIEEDETGKCLGAEAKRLYERVIHLAYTTLQYPIRVYEGVKRDWVEPLTLAHMLVCRSMYNGMYEYVTQHNNVKKAE